MTPDSQNKMKTCVYDTKTPAGLRRDQKLLEAKLRYFPLMNVTKLSGSRVDYSRQVRDDVSLLRVELETGRKHQIRAQLG
jgi:23S rRNA-/tRNA-specific pseudouridylate synthase